MLDPDDIAHVIEQFGLVKDTVSRTDYETYGRYWRGTISKRFGSWFDALTKAGLSTKRPSPITKQQCIDELRRVAKTLNTNVLTQAQFTQKGQFSVRPILRNFDNWGNALTAAGLERSRNFRKRVSDEDYFSNIERMWIALGRQPKYKEVSKPFSDYSSTAYENRFGSWRNALEAFVDY